jgi:hypothetical protein
VAMRHFSQLELARRWSISPRTLERWRWLGQGLRYLKIGSRVVYRLDDVEAFEAERLRTSTSPVSDTLTLRGTPEGSIPDLAVRELLGPLEDRPCRPAPGWVSRNDQVKAVTQAKEPALGRRRGSQ